MNKDLVKLSEHRVRHDKTMDRLAEILAKSESIEQSTEVEVGSAQLEAAEISRLVLELMAFQKVFEANQLMDGFYQSRVWTGSFLRPEVRKCWKFTIDSRAIKRENTTDEDLFGCVAWTEDGEVFVREIEGKFPGASFKEEGTIYTTQYSRWERVEKAAENWSEFDGGGVIDTIGLMIKACEMQVAAREQSSKNRQKRLTQR